MSRRGKILLILGLAAAAAFWVIVEGTFSERWKFPGSSTYASGPSGCKALYLLLEELGLPVARFEKPFLRLESRRGLLVITNPDAVKFTGRELKRLKEWVSEGNRLLMFLSPASDVVDEEPKESGTKKGRSKVTVKPTDRLSRYFGLSLKEMGDKPRRELDRPLPGIGESARISVSDAVRWNKPSSDWTELVGDGDWPIVVERKQGKGSIVAVSDATLTSNKELGREQNLRLVLALILKGGHPSEILFDEYHHGHAIQDNVWAYFGTSVFLSIILQGFVGAGLFFYSRRAAYSGRFRSLQAPRGRSSMEYVDSMANIFQSCRAGSAALEAILARFLSQISRRSGVPAERLAQAASKGPATGVAPPQEDLAALIKECRRIAGSESKPAEALAMARKLARMRETVSKRRRPVLSKTKSGG
jgi:hypothetical protein